MLTVIKKKCLRCGHSFEVKEGGIIMIVKLLPDKCPKCGSRLTI